MDKTPKPTIVPKNKTKRARVKKKPEDRLCNFMFINTWQEKEASKSFIELLVGRMLEYFKDKSVLTIEEFLDEEGIGDKTYSRWRKDHAVLQEVHEYTLRRLAVRREKGMLTGELKEKSVMYIQHLFSKRWDDANHYWSDMKKNENEKSASNINVLYCPLETDDGRVIELEDKSEDKN